MTKNILITCILFLSFTATHFAQTTITNAGFENWQNVGTDTEEPNNWNSIKTASGNSTAISFAPKSCFQEGTNPHTGTYCARLVTGNAFGQIAPGAMTTGRLMVPSLNATEGYIKTVPGNADFSMSFTARPDSLVFWIRYTRAGNDYPSVNAFLHVGEMYTPEVPVNGNHPDSSANIIARAEWEGPTSSVSSWTRVSVPFVYVDGRTPQYILITSTPTANSSPSTAGSILYLDDFEPIYNPTIATGTVNAGPHYVNVSTGANVSVPFTLTGIYGGNNTVTAQLSDASGSFASPVTIGSVAATTSGTVSANIPAGTSSSTGYRIRVVSSNPAITAADNGADITVTLVSAAVTPSSTQSILAGVNGNTLTVAETPTGTGREWKYSTTSGTGYISFIPAETGTTYTPNFATNGNYYIICESQIQGLTAVSNEVEISVSSVTLTTGTLSATIFDFSPNSPDGAVDVPFTTSGAFNAGNVFTAQLSDASGSFASPTDIGTLTSVNAGTISATIVNNTPAGTGYRIRVVGSDPAVSGADNGVDVTIDQFSNSISSAAPQTILVNVAGAFLTVSESQNATAREWKYTTTSGSNYQSFSSAETSASYTPLFAGAGVYYVVCESTNQYSDEVTSNEVQITVTVGTGINNGKDIVSIWNTGSNLAIDLTRSAMIQPSVSVTDLSGKVIYNNQLISNELNNIDLSLNSGVYLVRVADKNHVVTTRIATF